MPKTEDYAPENDIARAWDQLFDALEKLKEESRKQGFATKGFRDRAGIVWGTAALVRRADRGMNYLRRAVGDRL